MTQTLPQGFSTDDLELLAYLLEEAGIDHATPNQIRPRPANQLVPLSFAQERLWFIDQLEPGNPAYNILFAVQIDGSLHVEYLQQSFNAVIARHESLRTSFPVLNDQPIQAIAAKLDFDLTIVDLRYLAVIEQASTIEQLSVEQRSIIEQQLLIDSAHRFDLARGPLLYGRLLWLTEQQYVLILNLHHAIFDGWSLAIFIEELRHCYSALLAGQVLDLAPAALQYADFSYWQREYLQGEVLAKQLAFWQNQFAGRLPTLALPTDRPRPKHETGRGTALPFRVDQVLTEQLQHLAQREHATMFMLLLAAFQLVLARYSQQQEFVVGSPIANRDRVEIEHLIGFFVNMLLLRCDVQPQLSFREFLAQVRETTLEAYAHQDLPFEQLVEVLQPDRGAGYGSLFQVMFVLQNTPKVNYEIADLQLRFLDTEAHSTKYDLTMTLTETATGLEGWFEYNTDLYDQVTIQRMLGHYQQVLRIVAATPDQALNTISVFDEQAQTALFNLSNQTQYDFGATPFLERFAKQVVATPNAIAVRDADQRYSYQALQQRAMALAAQLQQHGVRQETLVPILLPRTGDFVVAVLGVFYAGAAYLPLDPAWPAQRIAQILQGFAIPALVCEPNLARWFAENVQPLLTSHNQPQLIEQWNDAATKPVAIQPHPQQLAYTLFTSGSTGTPKGVMIDQAGMLNHLLVMNQVLELQAHDVVAQTASQCFDISVWQMLSGLLVGATVAIIDDQTMRDPLALAQSLAEQQVTIFEPVPSLLQALLETLQTSAEQASLHRLRWVLPTGEALQPVQARQWFANYPQIPLLNAYGPAECADDVTLQRLDSAPTEGHSTMPIGKPVANMQVFVLDPSWQLLPLGAVGELYIGGVGVGRGYLNDPARTASAFVPNPFADNGSRLYRTGDLVRQTADGVLHFIGRADQQVKVRGYRIELGEIEAVLAKLNCLREAAVHPWQQQLVAYLVPVADTPELISLVQNALQQRLPSYMLPNQYLVLDQLPRNRNGKLDRQQLPAPNPASLGFQTPLVAPRTQHEVELAAIWADVLRLDVMSIDANFFSSGGHSLLATRVMLRTRQHYGRDLPLRMIFEAPTIREFAALLEQQQAASTLPNLLVPIKPQGSLTPLVCVHAIAGTVGCYSELARALDPAQPLYALQAPGIDGGATYARVEAIAQDYCQALRQLQPQGPYRLAGWSFGGLVVLEMARQLQLAGEQVSMLSLIDSFLSEPTPDPLPLIQSFAADLFADVDRLAAQQIDWHAIVALPAEQQLAALYQQAQQARLIDSDLPFDLAQRLYAVFTSHAHAMQAYQPAIYLGEAQLLQAQANPAAARCWQAVIPNLHIQVIGGDHSGILRQPYVHVLASAIEQRM